MKTIRPYATLGQTDLGWLSSRHSFSFGHYYDPAHMGFGPLRVINNDHVAGGGGFAPHSHQNMEIISYVLSGGLAHQDSLGNSSTIKAGHIQLMSAGSGITHSEYNADAESGVHFLQIWIKPDRLGTPPSYQELDPTERLESGGLVPLVTSDGCNGTLAIKQDAMLSMAHMALGDTLSVPLSAHRRYWLQVTHGTLDHDGIALSAGDGMAIEAENTALDLKTKAPATFLWFDLPGGA